MTPTAVTAFVQPQRRADRIHDTFILISNSMRQEPALMPTEPLPTSLGDGAETPASYMEPLPPQAAPDGPRRLDAIGDFVIDDSILLVMRDRQLRDPAVPSVDVEHIILAV